MVGGHRPPLQGEELLPGCRQLCAFDFARDASLEFRMENRACPVNHDDIFPSFGANRVRHTRRNHNADVVVAAMIVAVDEESHNPPRQPCPGVTQNHFNASLQKEHHVPLLVIIAAQRIVFRFIDIQSSQPIGGVAFRDTRRRSRCDDRYQGTSCDNEPRHKTSHATSSPRTRPCPR